MPEATIHPTPQQLAEFGRGNLPERAAAAVAAHLKACSVCRQSVANVPPVPLVPCPDLPPELARHPKYLILRELGRGGMGVVYQARQTVMNRPVVIKVISPSVLDRPDSLERFRREVQAAAQLSHPNIVTAYDAEQAGALQMLIMEFVPGQSLAEILEKRGPLPVAKACHYMRQAALGLQHAHDRGMVHRDIKPNNLILTPKGQIKILDFGLAKIVSERGMSKGLTSSDAYMGTPEYSAPEQAEDARTADIRADLYSLGCTLYCLLAGRPPFREDTAMKTILAHIQKAAQPLMELRSDVPERLWRIVERLLAKEPAKRYQKPIEVVQALAPFAKSGSKSELKGPPEPEKSVSSPGKGTKIAADTNQLKKVLREVPAKTPQVKSPVKAAAASTNSVRQGEGARPSHAAWWKRPKVQAAAVCGSLALILAAIIVNGMNDRPTNGNGDTHSTPNGDTATVTFPPLDLPAPEPDRNSNSPETLPKPQASDHPSVNKDATKDDKPPFKAEPGKKDDAIGHPGVGKDRNPKTGVSSAPTKDSYANDSHVEKANDIREKSKQKAIPEIGEGNPKSKASSETGGPAEPMGSDDFAQMAKQATHPAVKTLFQSLTTPYDLVVFKPSSVTVDGERKVDGEQKPREEKIVPNSIYLGDNPGSVGDERLRFTPLPKDGKPGKPFVVDSLMLQSVRPYEQLAQDKVRRFLNVGYEKRKADDPLHLSRSALLATAEKALLGVLNWHQSAIVNGKRRGQKWDDVKNGVQKQLLDEVLVERMKVLAQAKDWRQVLRLTRLWAVTYRNADVRERLFRPIAGMILSALKTPAGDDREKKKALKILQDLEKEFPDNPALQQLRDTLRKDNDAVGKAGLKK